MTTARRSLGPKPHTAHPHGPRSDARSIVARINAMPVTPAHMKIVAVVALGLFFENYELFLTGALSSALQRDFAVSEEQMPAILGAGFFGAFVGAVALSRLADRIGRRRAMILTLSTFSLFSLAAAFAPNAPALIALRVLAGVGLGGELPIAVSYLGDLLPAARRGRWTAIAFTAAYLGVPAVGFLGAALVDRSPLGLAGWRWLFLIGGLGAALVWLARRNLPESPRWLAAMGRTEEAEQIVARLETSADPTRYAPTSAEAMPDTGSTSEIRHTFRDLLRRPLARRTTLMAGVSVLQAIGYYGFGSLAVLVLTQEGHSVVRSLAYTSVSYIGYPVGAAISATVMERLERKWILAGSAALMAVLGLGYANSATPTAIMTLGFLYTLASNIMANSYHIYQSEQFPTAVRAGADGALYSLSRLASAAMPFVLVPLLHHTSPTLVVAVISAVMTGMVLLVLAFGVRTTGRSLEDIAD
ncbi:MFS transporter [Streptomyces sp. NPDC050743]|uniref:MFS transporter n=1 Tax=Streptomyces sp. NPDC050743 TaxID=3365634 RepID=UPI0037B8DD73